MRYVLRRKEQMLRISTAEERLKEVTLRLEGRLASGWIGVLESECQQWIRQGKRVVLDFSGVTSIDDRGARFARSLQKYEVKIVNPPLLIKDLLSRGEDS